jgi:hypothetical protein
MRLRRKGAQHQNAARDGHETGQNDEQENTNRSLSSNPGTRQALRAIA